MNINELVFFDLETSGLDTKEDKIVQLGILIGDKEYEWLFNPEREISEGAYNVHKISLESVKNKPTFREKADEIYELIKDKPIAGYNCNNFDYKLLKNEFKRCNIDWEPKYIIDIYLIWKKLEDKKLKTAYKRFCNKELINAHDALTDIKATKEIMIEMCKIWPNEDFSVISKENNKYIKNNLLTFGKYKGKDILSIYKEDPKYIFWLLGTKSNFPKSFRDKIKNIIQNG